MKAHNDSRNIDYSVFHSQPIKQEPTMQWSKPTFNEMRFGFEVTMYINNR
jgi:coenzyme PQQ precursor peptide PqqA